MVRSMILAAGLLGANASAAMLLGFGADVDYYAPEVNGYFDYKNTQTDFGNDDESGYQIGAYFEHPVPVLPNLRIDLTTESSFSGIDPVLGGVNTVSFDQIDITPYYEILDNVVDIDIGVTFKVLDGQVEGAINESFSEVIPMGYIGAAVAFPGLPLSLAGNVKYIGYDGDSFTDARIKAVWDIAAGVHAQAGYRYESLKIDDRFDINTDVTFKGPFVGLGFTF
ncbi:MAG: TIGR04219 family outer membrane beta-barrel protein [Campylobacterales bacterium]|nr:TIGR04219 family outer membrane beta-barrel protein [Campylobacterales bacterium]